MHKVFQPQAVASIPFTKEGYEKMLAEREELLKSRPEAVEHLRKAREMGDLSENGYYHASRARLSSLDARLRQLERLRRYGVIVETRQSNTVELGSTVVLKSDTNEMTLTIVGGYESNPREKTISFKSPIGSALLHKREGQIITVQAPAGAKEYVIKRVYIT